MSSTTDRPTNARSRLAPSLSPSTLADLASRGRGLRWIHATVLPPPGGRKARRSIRSSRAVRRARRCARGGRRRGARPECLRELQQRWRRWQRGHGVARCAPAVRAAARPARPRRAARSLTASWRARLRTTSSRSPRRATRAPTTTEWQGMMYLQLYNNQAYGSSPGINYGLSLAANRVAGDGDKTVTIQLKKGYSGGRSRYRRCPGPAFRCRADQGRGRRERGQLGLVHAGLLSSEPGQHRCERSLHGGDASQSDLFNPGFSSTISSD